MLAGGVTESIRYFAGYLDIFEDAKLARLHYDGEPETVATTGWHAGAPVFMSAPASLTDADATRSGPDPRMVPNKVARADSAEMLPHGELGGYGSFAGAHAFIPVFGVSSPIFVPMQQVTTTSFLVAEPPPYEISFSAGGNGRSLEISQTNLMLDLDQMLTVDAAALQSASQAELLDAMLGVAADSVPESALFPSGGVDGWTMMLRQDAAARVDGDAATASMDGRYVNGSLVADDRIDALSQLPDGPNPIGRDGESNDDLPPQETSLETGGNVSVNQALIVDLNEASRTFAVEGNVFTSNSIVQSIVYRDSDMIWHGPDTRLETAGSSFVNDAIFRDVDPIFGSAARITSVGVEVRVDIFDGDLIDAKTIVQRNLIADGDIVSQSVTETTSVVDGGGNWQLNSAQLFDWSQYDLIVVLGDYYAINTIVQISALVDDDLVVAKAGGDSGDGSAVSTGNNVVSNQATIESIGADWSDMPENFSALAARLAAGEDPGLDAWAGVAGSATGELDVLIVNGDYYDINAIYQLNVVIDNDWVVQSGELHGKISTGANHIVNDARIIDIGGLSKQFVGGQVYEDAMLMQASLAYGDDATKTVINGDTETLASEFVAFAGSDAFGEAEGQDDPSFKAMPQAIFDDLGSILV